MTEIDVMNAFKEKGIEVTVFQSPLKTTEKVVIDTSEHDKQIRAEVIDGILNKVNSYIADMKKYFSETQDETFLCAISEAQKVRNIIRDMLKEQKHE